MRICGRGTHHRKTCEFGSAVTLWMKMNNRAVVLFVAAALVVIGVAASVPPTAPYSSDSGPKYWQTEAFAAGEGG